MLTSQAFLFFLALLLLAALLEPLAERFRFPFSILLVLIGFIGSEACIRIFGVDTGIRWDNINSIISYVILPILIFWASIELDIKSLWGDIIPISLLSLPLVLVSAAITAVGVYYGINHPGFPWTAALLTGALLSAPDAAAVLSLLKKSNAPRRLSLLLEGESLFNDATAVVLFSILIAMALSGEQNSTWGSALMQFLSVFCGGLAVGAMIGIIAHVVLKVFNGTNVYVLVTVVSAYTSYILADNFLHLSGVMAVLSAGLVIGSLDRRLQRNEVKHFVDEFWRLAHYIAEALIFLLAGVTINLTMFTDQWLAILIGITAVLAARVIIIFGVFPLANHLPGMTPVPVKQQIILTWGGVRGTMTLALALSLPLSLSYWYTIQSIAYGVVLFTLFVQATTMNPLIRRLNLES
ncbi:MAG: Na Exchanger protein [Gammaproteobacteria bacterium]|nr:Na Exchanger protein [Gammaproteobacteria bacterium]